MKIAYQSNDSIYTQLFSHLQSNTIPDFVCAATVNPYTLKINKVVTVITLYLSSNLYLFGIRQKNQVRTTSGLHSCNIYLPMSI